MMHIGDVLDDRQAEARSTGTGRVRPAVIRPVKAVKNQWQLIFRNHIAVIHDFDRHDLPIRPEADPDTLSFLTVLDGIADQIIEKSRQQITIGFDDLRLPVRYEIIAETVLLKIRVALLEKLCQQLDDIHLRHVHIDFSIGKLREAEQLLDQLLKAHRLVVGDIQILLLHLQ